TSFVKSGLPTTKPGRVAPFHSVDGSKSAGTPSAAQFARIVSLYCGFKPSRWLTAHGSVIERKVWLLGLYNSPILGARTDFAVFKRTRSSSFTSQFKPSFQALSLPEVE